MRVICVKWGNKYGPEWVHNLKGMVDKHLSIDHDFVCMTDKPIEGIDCVPCEDALPGWWSKVGLFKPGKFEGKNIYFDLDVVISGSIDWLADYGPELHARDDFSYSLKKPEFLDPKMAEFIGGQGTVNSSVMVWSGDAGRDVWDRFTPDVMDRMHGDQNWISYSLFPDNLKFLPDDKIYSYKYHVQRGVTGAPITVFHGNPKVTELPQDNALRRLWHG